MLIDVFKLPRNCVGRFRKRFGEKYDSPYKHLWVHGHMCNNAYTWCIK